MNILDIFYNYIIKEASNGEVNCFLTYRMLFATFFKETNEIINVNEKYNHLVVPILTINNKALFDKLLVTYVNLCLDFYDNDNFRKEIIDKEEYEISKNSKEKYIMTMLWANATYEDFLNPEEYLKKRIEFIRNNLEESFTSDYSDMLNGCINFNIVKDKIYNETPYKIEIKCINNDNEEYYFPEVNFGIYNDIVYIYAVQRRTKNDSNYSKKINRLLFKIGEGYNNEEYIKDVSASFVVALNMAISYFHKLGFNKICIPSILLTRYNSRELLIENNKRLVNKEELQENNDNIQYNLTEKFIRTFLRLAYHYNLEVTLPLENDTNMYLELPSEMESNNTLLNETYNLISNNKKMIK